MGIMIGYFIVVLTTLGGFMLAGGKPVLLLQMSEFTIICGISLGLLIIATPLSILRNLFKDIKICLFTSSYGNEEHRELMCLLYELFFFERIKGDMALEELIASPKNNPIMKKYPVFLQDPTRLAYLNNALHSITESIMNNDQMEQIMAMDLKSMYDADEASVDVLSLVGDSLPGLGIIAAVLGIINTMSSIADGPEKVGGKVAAALTGTFLGVLGAYGFINPLAKRISFMHKNKKSYFNAMAVAIRGFVNGLSPFMAVEIAHRSLDQSMKMPPLEFEKMLKALNPPKTEPLPEPKK